MLGHGTPLKVKIQEIELAFVAEFLFVQQGLP